MPPYHSQPPPRAFDPRTDSPYFSTPEKIRVSTIERSGAFNPWADLPQLPTPENIRVSTIERWVEYLTDDPQYRILFEELFKHLILLPPLLFLSVLLHFTSPHLGSSEDFFAHAEHILIQCISLSLILFAFGTVALTLVDASLHIVASSKVVAQLRRWWQERK